MMICLKKQFQRFIFSLMFVLTLGLVGCEESGLDYEAYIKNTVNLFDISDVENNTKINQAFQEFYNSPVPLYNQFKNIIYNYTKSEKPTPLQALEVEKKATLEVLAFYAALEEFNANNGGITDDEVESLVEAYLSAIEKKDTSALKKTIFMPAYMATLDKSDLLTKEERRGMGFLGAIFGSAFSKLLFSPEKMDIDLKGSALFIVPSKALIEDADISIVNKELALLEVSSDEGLTAFYCVTKIDGEAQIFAVSASEENAKELMAYVAKELAKGAPSITGEKAKFNDRLKTIDAHIASMELVAMYQKQLATAIDTKDIGMLEKLINFETLFLVKRFNSYGDKSTKYNVETPSFESDEDKSTIAQEMLDGIQKSQLYGADTGGIILKMSDTSSRNSPEFILQNNNKELSLVFKTVNSDFPDEYAFYNTLDHYKEQALKEAKKEQEVKKAQIAMLDFLSTQIQLENVTWQATSDGKASIEANAINHAEDNIRLNGLRLHFLKDSQIVHELTYGVEKNIPKGKGVRIHFNMFLDELTLYLLSLVEKGELTLAINPYSFTYKRKWYEIPRTADRMKVTQDGTSWKYESFVLTELKTPVKEGPIFDEESYRKLNQEYKERAKKNKEEQEIIALKIANEMLDQITVTNNLEGNILTFTVTNNGDYPARSFGLDISVVKDDIILAEYSITKYAEIAPKASKAEKSRADKHMIEGAQEGASINFTVKSMHIKKDKKNISLTRDRALLVDGFVDPILLENASKIMFSGKVE